MNKCKDCGKSYAGLARLGLHRFIEHNAEWEADLERSHKGLTEKAAIKKKYQALVEKGEGPPMPGRPVRKRETTPEEEIETPQEVEEVEEEEKEKESSVQTITLVKPKGNPPPVAASQPDSSDPPPLAVTEEIPQKPPPEEVEKWDEILAVDPPKKPKGKSPKSKEEAPKGVPPPPPEVIEEWDEKLAPSPKPPKAKKGDPVPTTPKGSSELVNVVAPKNGVVVFRLGSVEIPLNYQDLYESFILWEDMKVKAGLTDTFSVALKDAMGVAWRILVAKESAFEVVTLAEDEVGSEEEEGYTPSDDEEDLSQFEDLDEDLIEDKILTEAE